MYLINSPILPNYGVFRLSGEISLAKARAMVRVGFESAIGHEATAVLLSQLLGVDVPEIRQRVQLLVGEKALVFRVKQRLPEGCIIQDIDELSRIPYEFSLLERIE